MKELSIEQKAKRYDEALEKSKRLYEQGTITESLCYVFPELVELEDEKIREEIMDIINSFDVAHLRTAGLPTRIPEYLAWLEKQDEHKKFRDSIQVGDKVTRNQDGMLVNLSQLKRIAKPNETKQGEQKPIKEHNICDTCDEKASCITSCPIKLIEQKPADKVEPKFKVGDTIKHLNGNVFHIARIDGTLYISDEGATISFGRENDWELIEQKPAWSEEDRDYFDAIIAKLEVTQDDVLLTDNQMDFLKSLKDRVQPQPKQEWSEEDDIRLNATVSFLERYKGIDYENTGVCISWLKSLRPQNRWKPSEEQMDALHYVTNFDYGGHKATLVSLYEQLKKLRKE